MYFYSKNFIIVFHVNSTTWNIRFVLMQQKMLSYYRSNWQAPCQKNLRSYKQKKAGLIPCVPDQAYCTQIRFLQALSLHQTLQCTGMARVAFKWAERTLVLMQSQLTFQPHLHCYSPCTSVPKQVILEIQHKISDPICTDPAQTQHTLLSGLFKSADLSWPASPGKNTAMFLLCGTSANSPY